MQPLPKSSVSTDNPMHAILRLCTACMNLAGAWCIVRASCADDPQVLMHTILRPAHFGTTACTLCTIYPHFCTSGRPIHDFWQSPWSKIECLFCSIFASFFADSDCPSNSDIFVFLVLTFLTSRGPFLFISAPRTFSSLVYLFVTCLWCRLPTKLASHTWPAADWLWDALFFGKYNRRSSTHLKSSDK